MKFRKNPDQKITPTNIRTGNTAPSFYIPKIENELAGATDLRARQYSSLGGSEEWRFFN